MSMGNGGLVLVTGGVSLLLLAACGSGNDPAQAGSTTTVEGVESSLTGSQDSRDAARAAAKACFDTYRMCKDTAGQDKHACREALKSCLPAEAPSPKDCGRMPPHAEQDGGAAPARDDDDEDSEADAGGHHEHGRHPGKHHCEHPPIPGKALAECKKAADASLAAGDDPTAVSAAYDQCVGDVFAARIAKLCHELDELCADANAPADACARIADACKMP